MKLFFRILLFFLCIEITSVASFNAHAATEKPPTTDSDFQATDSDEKSIDSEVLERNFFRLVFFEEKHVTISPSTMDVG